MGKYRVTNVQRRDEWGPNHGHMMQDYAIALEGEQGWIKLTQRVETKPPREGDELEGYVEEKTTSGGNPYRKFKKESGQFPTANAQSDSRPTAEKQDYIIQMLEELTGRREVQDVVVEPTDKELEDPFKDI